jgi:hypothetical protein
MTKSLKDHEQESWNNKAGSLAVRMKLPGAVLVAPTHSPGESGLGLPSSEGERHATRHHDPFKPELGSDTDNGRTDYAALFHHRLHFT